MICSVRSASCQTVEGDGDGDGRGQRPPLRGWLAGGFLRGFAGLAGFAEGGPGGGELADGEVAQPGGQRDEHEHHRPGREAPGQQQRESRQQPGRGQQRGHHGNGAEQPPGPARVLLGRRRRCYGIVCLSDLSDPCGTWPMMHEPTIGPGIVSRPRAPGAERPGAPGALDAELLGVTLGCRVAAALELQHRRTGVKVPLPPFRLG